MADVTITPGTVTANARAMRSVVFTTDQVGYLFFLFTGTLSYQKTTNGGATWGSAVTFDATGTSAIVAFDLWYDRWTPGDAGTYIHVWFFDTSADTVRYRALDTTTDTAQLSANATVFTGASAVAGRGAFVSGCKTRSGYFYCAFDIDAGAEKGFYRSLGTGAGATWASLDATFVEATLDTCLLFPASGTGDNNDCWALYYDASALALTLKLWDSSAVAATESATIQAHTDGATDLTGQFGYAGSVRHSDGHLIVAALSARDVAASTHQVFDLASTSSITTKTAIAASTDDHYYPQVCIDQSTDNIYVAYNGKRDGSEVLDTTTKVYYTKSTDGGATWSAGDTAYMEGAAGVVLQVWTPLSGLRFYAVWRVGTNLLGNAVNSVSLPAGPAGQSVTGAFVTSTSVVYSPQVVTPGAVTVTGTTLTSGAVVRAGTVTTLTAVTGATLASSVVLRTGTITTTTSVTGTTRGTTLALFPGAVSTTAAGAVGGASLASGAVVFPGLVTVGAVTVLGATRSSSAQLFPGVVTVAAPVAADVPFMWLM